MSHNLNLARHVAYNLTRTLMIPVTLFRVEGEYGVLPTADLDDAEVEILHEYNPYQ